MEDNSLNIKAYLDADERKSLLRLLTAGSVDDGKSTLIGRLLFDSKKLYEDRSINLTMLPARVVVSAISQETYPDGTTPVSSTSSGPL